MINKFNYYFVTLLIFGDSVQKYRGTWASLFTVLFLFTIIYFLKISVFVVTILLLIIFVYSFIAVASHIKEKENKDPKEVIIDEFIGQSIPIYLYEISHGTQKTSDEAIIFYGICFVLFRIFDILKPFPVNYFDKNYKNSFGVIMDDVCAGLYVVLSLICFMLLSSYLI